MISGTGTPHRPHAPQSPLGRFWAFIVSLDKLQIGMALFLCAVGLVFIYSTGVQAGRGAASFWRHLFWLGVGTAAYIVCSIPDPRTSRFRAIAFVAYPLAVLLLAVVLMFLRCRCSTHCRWLCAAGVLRSSAIRLPRLGSCLIIPVQKAGYA